MGQGTGAALALLPAAVPEFGISAIPIPFPAGSVNFHFECKPCENGTYSSSRGGWCRSWTEYGAANNRSSITNNHSSVINNQLSVIIVGNVLPCFENRHDDNTTTTTTKNNNSLNADPDPTFLRPQGEESYSIQFPEEEHGDKSQEKLSILSLKIYSELR
ncbi:hypothetical protein RLOC_00000669 [Lonchura striata]|uniref:Uncharacterized protein n=1 Tax=Lonchura striata TaxID=40157 RepID=A0A218UI39_9PASE|nr:hypothetical protein RLOC_00000669 [Lonchura striata domestica]